MKGNPKASTGFAWSKPNRPWGKVTLECIASSVSIIMLWDDGCPIAVWDISNSSRHPLLELFHRQEKNASEGEEWRANGNAEASELLPSPSIAVALLLPIAERWERAPADSSDALMTMIREQLETSVAVHEVV